MINEQSSNCETLKWIAVITSHAVVADFEVGFELLEARSSRFELGIGDADLARASPGAAPVKQSEHVRVALDVAEVELHAPAASHAAVQRSCQQQDLAFLTRRTKHFRLAVLPAALRHRWVYTSKTISCCFNPVSEFQIGDSD